jgi:hypothetical protein
MPKRSKSHKGNLDPVIVTADGMAWCTRTGCGWETSAPSAYWARVYALEHRDAELARSVANHPAGRKGATDA